MMTTLFGDIRLAARLLLKDKGFTLAAVAALALGIAANNTVFTIVNGVLLRDLPFEHPDRILAVGVKAGPGALFSVSDVSYPDARDWQEAARTFEGIGIYAENGVNVADETHAPERFLGAFVSANTFGLLGMRPLLGRDFRPEDDRDGAEPVALIGHDVWRNRYESDANIIGRRIRVNGITSVVIGVMPEGMLFPLRSAVWTPMAAVDRISRTNRENRRFRAFGKLKSGVTAQQADADLRRITAALATQYPTTNANIEGAVGAMRMGIGGPIRPLLGSMMGAVALVLLIACANVANLLLSRAASRAREVSVRMSMGASRWRIVRQLLIESLLLAAVAGTVGLFLSVGAIRLFWATASQTDPPYWMHFAMDWRVFGFLATVCLGTSIVFGLMPALYTSKTNLTDVLSDASRGGVGSRRGRRWSGVLVAGQLALTLVLLSGTGLLVRNVIVQATMTAGVDTEGLVRMRIDLPSPAYDAPERRLAFYRRLEDGLDATPALRATVANAVPIVGGASRQTAIAGRPEPAPGARPRATVVTVGRHYFDVVGARIATGRAFTGDDGTPGRGAAIVNERFVEMYLGTGDPIGQRVRVADNGVGDGGQDWLTIVAVVQNVRQRPPVDGGFDPVMYVPLAFNVASSTNVLVRRPSEPALAASLLRDQLRAIDPDLPVYEVQRLDDFIYKQQWAGRVFGSMFGIFGMVALVLATVGLYAVTAYAVSQRTREIGLRVALGAQAHHVWWLVTRGASWQIAFGLAIGIAGSVLVSRAVPVAITRVDGTDPVILFAAVALLVTIALVACLIPGRRALRLDPAAVLRSE
jgi:putative ABC transport system permease protein